MVYSEKGKAEERVSSQDTQPASAMTVRQGGKKEERGCTLFSMKVIRSKKVRERTTVHHCEAMTRASLTFATSSSPIDCMPQVTISILTLCQSMAQGAHRSSSASPSP